MSSRTGPPSSMTAPQHGFSNFLRFLPRQQQRCSDTAMLQTGGKIKAKVTAPIEPEIDITNSIEETTRVTPNATAKMLSVNVK